MVCVWPPHTSMNLNCPPCWEAPSPARRSMAPNSFRAAAGSRNSSTNFISLPPAQTYSYDGRGVEGFHLGGVGVAELLDGRQREQRLGFVDLGHREPDVDQHPVVRLRVVPFQQPHTDGPLHSAHVDLRQIVCRIGDLNDPSRNTKAHVISFLCDPLRPAMPRLGSPRPFRAQQILGSGSPTSMSTIRVPPNPVRSTTVSAGSATTSPTSAASAPNGCDRSASSPARASCGATTATNLPSLAT